MNIVSLAVLTSSFAFSKYRRAQITPISDLYCIESTYDLAITALFACSPTVKIILPVMSLFFPWLP